MPAEKNVISIADAVEDLRTQIVEAIDRGKAAQRVSFELSEVEVELKLVAEQKVAAGVKAGWSFVVFSAGVDADAEIAKARTHTVRFKLSVNDAETGKSAVLMADG